MAENLGGSNPTVGFSDVDDLEDVTSHDGLSQLILAVQDGNLGRIQKLVQSGCDVRQCNAHNWTALTHAIVECQWDCFLALSRAFCLQDLRNTRKIDCLLSAIEEGAFDKAVKLAQRNKFIREYMTQQERSAFMFLLISYDCPPNALHEMLKNRSTDVNAKYLCGMTPLISAAINGNHETLKVLLHPCHKSDLYVIDDLGKSAMSYAIEKGCSECLELLLHASTRLKKGNELALEIATRMSIARGRGECLTLLLNWKQETVLTSMSSSALLCEAVKEGSLQCLEILLEFGAEPSWSNEYGETALMYAVIRNNLQCFDRLLEHGVQVNAVDYEGNSALMHAVQRKRPDCVPKLLEFGADVNLVNVLFETAISSACCHEDTDILRLILTSADSANNIRIEPHSLALKIGIKLCNANALILLMEHDIFMWHWMDKLSTDTAPAPPGLVALAAVKSSIRPGCFVLANQTMTLLKLAFHYDCHIVAQFLMANLYLSKYDVSILPHDTDFIEMVRSQGSHQSIALINQLTSEPWSLQTLAFLAISSSINDWANCPHDVPIQRDAMIQQLPLPRKFVDRLLFKSAVSQVCVDKWKFIGNEIPFNFMSNQSPLWNGAVMLPEPCLESQCRGNYEGLRQRFQIMRNPRVVVRSLIEEMNG